MTHAWIVNATDVRLALVHRDHNRWLNLPNADLWAVEYADRAAEMAAIWTEIQARKSAVEDVRGERQVMEVVNV